MYIRLSPFIEYQKYIRLKFFIVGHSKIWRENIEVLYNSFNDKKLLYMYRGTESGNVGEGPSKVVTEFASDKMFSYQKRVDKESDRKQNLL